MAYRVPQLCDLIKTLEQHLFVDKEALELGPGDFRNDCVLKLPEIKVFELRTKPSKVGYVERRVLLHSTLDALIEALARYGPPEIMNTDQGSQFTGSAWITTLTDAGVAISMDGRGRCMDNTAPSTSASGRNGTFGPWSAHFASDVILCNDCGG